MKHRRVALLTVVLVIAGVCAGAGRNGPAAAKHPAGRARGGPLPDSVLARTAAGREVTASRFSDDWRRLKPPERPDSLTPETAREFLQLLVGKEALAEAALRERWVWTAEESAGYAALMDGLVLRAALDSALEATRRRLEAAGDSVPDEAGLGLIARNQRIASLGVAFDDTLLARLARAFAAIPPPSRDSSLMAQLRALGAMPQVEDSLLARPLATGRGVRYTVRDFLEWWRRTNPITRPRIATAEQVHDLVANGIFEQDLRRAGAARRLAERPDIAAELARRRELISVEHLVGREVYGKIATDSVTLERHYRARIDEWSLPLRARLIRMVLADRASATQMRMRLLNAAEAESLAARGARAGAAYHAVVSAESDSAMFAAALAAGVSAVIGPDSTRRGWSVARVTEILPPRHRTFAEARQVVRRSWYGEEGERLMQALLDRVRREAQVTVNDRAVSALTHPSQAQ